MPLSLSSAPCDNPAVFLSGRILAGTARPLALKDGGTCLCRGCSDPLEHRDGTGGFTVNPLPALSPSGVGQGTAGDRGGAVTAPLGPSVLRGRSLTSGDFVIPWAFSSRFQPPRVSPDNVLVCLELGFQGISEPKQSTKK